MRLIITRKAQKDLESLDPAIQKRIAEKFDQLLVHPLSVDLKKLKGYENLWRLRVGDYRIILEIREQEITIYALRIMHRREVYR